MACYHKQCDVLMKPCEHIILIMIPTVVRVEVNILLAEPMYSKEVMTHAHHGIGTLTHVNCLIDEADDLALNGFTAKSEDSTFQRKNMGPACWRSFGCWAMSNE